MIKAKPKEASILILTVVLVVLCAWRFLPHSSPLVFAEPDHLASIKGSMTIAATPGGNLQMDVYEVTLTREDEGFREIIALLTSTKYRQDLRNLFPLLLREFTTFGGDKTAILGLQWESETDGPCVFTFSESAVLVTPFEGSSRRVYHPTDHSLLDQLAQIVQNYGTKK